METAYTKEQLEKMILESYQDNSKEVLLERISGFLSEMTYEDLSTIWIESI